MPRCAGRTVHGAQCKRNVSTGALCFKHVRQNGEEPAAAPAAPAAAPAAPAAAPAAPAAPVRRGDLNRDILEGLRSDDQRRQLIALQRLRLLYSAESIQELDTQNVIERIIDLYFDSEIMRIRDSAIWALINITATVGDVGTRAILRADPEFLTDAVDLLLVAHPHIVEQTLWCLGNIAGSGPQYTHMLLELDVETICIQFLENVRQPRDLRKYAAFLLSNLARHMTREKAGETLENLSDLPAASLRESEINIELMWTINTLEEVTDSLPPIYCALFVELLSTRSKHLFSPVFKTIGSICSKENNSSINTLLECGITDQLQKLLEKPACLPQVLWILSNLATETKGAEKIINTPNLLLDLNNYIRLVNNDVIWIISNLGSRGSMDVVKALLRCGCFTTLFLHFRSMTPTQRGIVLDGTLNFLQKGKAQASIVLRPLLANLEPEFGADPLFQSAIGALTEIPFETPATALTEVPHTNAGLLAAARMTEMLSRGAEPEGVDVSDLLFTAGDIRYLSNNRYEFGVDGLLRVSVSRAH